MNRDFKAEDVEHKSATKRGPTQRSRFCCRFAGRVTIPTGVFARPFAAGDDAQLHRAEFHAKLDTALIKARPTSPQFACKMQNRSKKKKQKKETQPMLRFQNGHRLTSISAQHIVFLLLGVTFALTFARLGFQL